MNLDRTVENQQNGCAPSEDSDQPGHPPRLIRVFAIRIKEALVFSYPLSAQRRLWSNWADAQADLSPRWVHTHFVGFVMSRLIFEQAFWEGVQHLFEGNFALKFLQERRTVFTTFFQTTGPLVLYRSPECWGYVNKWPWPLLIKKIHELI